MQWRPKGDLLEKGKIDLITPPLLKHVHVQYVPVYRDKSGYADRGNTKVLRLVNLSQICKIDVSPRDVCQSPPSN